MMLKLQIISGVILCAGLLFIINMIRRRKLELKYALAWLFAILCMLIADIFPPILSLISYLFGIATPVNTLFLLGFIFALILLFVLTVAVSRQAERIRKLSQTIAVNEEKMNELNKRICYNGDDKQEEDQ